MIITELKDAKAQRAVAMATLKAEVLEVLKRNILPFWMEKMQDQQHRPYLLQRHDGSEVRHRHQRFFGCHAPRLLRL